MDHDVTVTKDNVMVAILFQIVHLYQDITSQVDDFISSLHDWTF